MNKVGLVLEGGAMRGMYTAGVLDVMMDNNVYFDTIIGVSAGALFGVNYLSKQKGRVIRYNKRFCKDLRYISIPSLLFTGNIVNKNFAYYKVSTKLDKFDDETFKKSNTSFYATVTNLKSGKPEYIKIDSCLEEMEVLRASSAMPLVTKPVKINDKLYLDGAIGDSIPVQKALEMGCDKIVVVLTRPLNYRKSSLTNSNIKRINRKYKKYPNFIKAMINRPNNYNLTLDLITDLENKKEIFVIRPSESIDINVIERNPDKLQSVYELGVKDIKKLLKEVLTYLHK